MADEIKPKKSIWKKWWLWVIIIFVIIIIVSANSGEKTERIQPLEERTETGVRPETSAKSYQEIFTFSGDGAKKSEPFNIEGDRFKIAYDCYGDPSFILCTAFVYRVGSTLPQAVMNSGDPVKDETIIYTSMAGKGEYYIDANVIGSFTMTVYDYK